MQFDTAVIVMFAVWPFLCLLHNTVCTCSVVPANIGKGECCVKKKNGSGDDFVRL